MVVGAILFAGATFGGLYAYDSYKSGINDKQTAKAEGNYAENAGVVIADMAAGYAEASEMVEGYSVVWRDAIDSRTDFNAAIQDKVIEYKQYAKFMTLDDYSTRISENMSNLQDPPEKYIELHDKIKELHAEWSKLRQQAESPTGSLIEFNKNINNIDQEFTRVVDELEIVMDNEVKIHMKEQSDVNIQDM